MKITKEAPATADKRLSGVQQATIQDVEAAIAISKAATTDGAWEILGDKQGRAVLDAAFRVADEATRKGHDAVAARLAEGKKLPDSWVERIVQLEVARLEARWAVDDHYSAHSRAGLVEQGDPSALAVRIITPAVQRHGWLDAPAPEALDQIEQHAPGWDVENTKTACRLLLTATVWAKYAPA